MSRHATALETVRVIVPDEAVYAYEAAFQTVCGNVGLWLDEDTGLWHIEGVRERGIPGLDQALALARLASGTDAEIIRTETPADGWLARTYESFPEQLVGRRFAVRGTHLNGPDTPGRITLRLDAGVAFGSGEHGSTRGCLLALEQLVAKASSKRRVIDLGTGSGILAMAAARLIKPHPVRVMAADIEPWSVRTAQQNAVLNRVSRQLDCLVSDGWKRRPIRARAPYDLIFANILARPLCGMAYPLAQSLEPGGHVILAGLLATQMRMVLAAYRRQGLVLWKAIPQGHWMTLILHKRPVASLEKAVSAA
ncbi:50S ribosomal protein L11 methyltransferase [Granulibacter bethesdensis]|uniref:50S ribosomal protein L11 methyltransferase n=1 Tax=Granulibacter bethesdensis TaxID=364410 RepID=UPI00090BA5BE|nr:50S ribosomal protein L11 methyltransferase [Granulibacter bethesdensis]APH58500.1 Ribosomal protein L11 methyltransferase [Granulibacter bethesdensis]